MKRIILTFIIGVTMATAGHGENIKKPNVSGQFYEANPQRLSSHIKSFLKAADVAPTERDVEIVISPHAGHMFSGGVAAYGYKAVSRKNFKTIVVLAPSHYYATDGISVWQSGGYQTPLGTLNVDEDFAAQLVNAHEKFSFDPQAFEREHSLEVQLPFLQTIFTDFKLVPVIVGQPSFETLQALAKSLNRIIGSRDDVLVVLSTDMSHFHDDAFARKMDHRTLEAIKSFDIEKLWKQCKTGMMELCGIMPVTAGLLLAKERGLTGLEVLKYANSSDVTGDKGRVVGYASIIIFNEETEKKENKNEAEAEQPGEGKIAPLTLEQKRRLIQIAKETIVKFILTGQVAKFDEQDPRLSEAEGAFVTLHRYGHLRGCIGNIVSDAPLYKTVRDMAISAAVKDPRFPPLSKEELGSIDLEISVLSKPWRVTDVEEIEPGVHGVIVRKGLMNQGVFLPQVATEFGWGREEFLSNLCSHKAGLPPDAWKDPATEIQIFTADVFSEKDIK
ncbi:MAG: AmmeMemoRadiSam system protein B [Candidatus Omnitrophica bacterium]|nr:AmmeMemoRadiSam system protein B [Candidatus Omnitrophota bacterium]